MGGSPSASLSKGLNTFPPPLLRNTKLLRFRVLLQNNEIVRNAFIDYLLSAHWVESIIISAANELDNSIHENIQFHQYIVSPIQTPRTASFDGMVTPPRKNSSVEETTSPFGMTRKKIDHVYHSPPSGNTRKRNDSDDSTHTISDLERKMTSLRLLKFKETTDHQANNGHNMKEKDEDIGFNGPSFAYVAAVIAAHTLVNQIHDENEDVFAERIIAMCNNYLQEQQLAAKVSGSQTVVVKRIRQQLRSVCLASRRELFEVPFLDGIWIEQAIASLDNIKLSLCVAEKRNNGFCPLIYVNQSFLAMFQAERSNCIGRSCKFMQSEFTEQDQIQLLSKAVREEKRVRVVINNIKGDGSEFINLASICPVESVVGDTTQMHFVGSQYDATEVNASMRQIKQIDDIVEIARIVLTCVM
jgi:hypothetical protein